MTQDAAIEVVAALQLLNHHILMVLIAGFTEHSFMKGGIKFLTHNAHRCHAQLLEHVNQLLVEALITAVQGLRLFALWIELLTSAFKVVHNWQDLAQRAAGELQLEVVLIATLPLAEIVEISGNAHVLTAQGFVLFPQAVVLSLQLLKTGVVVAIFSTISRRLNGCIPCGR